MLSDDISAPPNALNLHNSAVDRRFQRVNVSILGRYMLADRREFPCQVLSMSPGDAVVIAPVPGIVGERIIAYLDHQDALPGQALASARDDLAYQVHAVGATRQCNLRFPPVLFRQLAHRLRVDVRRIGDDEIVFFLR